MKTITLATFTVRSHAEKAIDMLHNDLKISTDDISYLYKNTDGEIKEHNAEDIASDTPAEGAEKGANVGAIVGAAVGIAAVAATAPVVGPVLAGGAFATALGMTGAAGVTAGASATGAITGSLIGALYSYSFDVKDSKEYEDRVMAGDILVAVDNTDGNSDEVRKILSGHEAQNIRTYDIGL